MVSKCEKLVTRYKSILIVFLIIIIIVWVTIHATKVAGCNAGI